MFSWWIMLWLLSLTDLSIQMSKNKVLCDTTIKERESEEFHPCIKFKHQYEDCSHAKIERGFVHFSKMGVGKCFGRDDDWIECSCREYALCIGPAKKRLRVFSRTIDDKCEPEILNELHKKEEEWSGETLPTFPTTTEVITSKRRRTTAASTTEPEANNTVIIEAITSTTEPMTTELDNTISEAVSTVIDTTTEVTSTEIASPEATIPPVENTTAELTADGTEETTTEASKTNPTAEMASETTSETEMASETTSETEMVSETTTTTATAAMEQDTSTLDGTSSHAGYVVEWPKLFFRPLNSSTSGRIDIVLYSMLGSVIHTVLL
ncbi:hypothetical protein V3C99_010930 [Haemonchus contortus]